MESNEVLLAGVAAMGRWIRCVSRQPLLMSCWGGISVLMLVLGLVPVSNASRELLSDMDCVVEPSLLVELGAAVPGLLASVPHDRSDPVTAGSVVASLDKRVESLAVAMAEARARDTSVQRLRMLAADLGARTLARNQELRASRSISAQALDQVETESRIATLQVQAALEEQRLAALDLQRAEAELQRRDLHSPIDGVITERYRAAGEYLDGDAVYQIAQLDPLYVEVIVPLDYRASIELGGNAGVTLAAPGFENRSLEATVERVDAVADAPSATFGVRLRLDNPEYRIPSGVRCQIDFFAS